MNREEWDSLHKCCPNCRSTHLIQTLIRVPEVVKEDGTIEYEDDVNSFECQACGTKGKRSELVPLWSRE
jgi:hypothetical protein